ncbi:MFS transporter [Kribbella turkmenica]|uniref:MFS transporter n=1 Tax=Kribbella turkmenica TaxID=2530375 RepID=UPI00192DB886|nr:MFS transporter [Kribbella turkmenica]
MIARTDAIRIGIGLSSMGYLLAGLGACVAILARDLDESTGRLALLSSAFAVGLFVVAVVGPMMLRSWALPTVLRLGSLVCAAGALLLAVAPAYGVAIAGGLGVGLGGALLVLVAPLVLHGPTAASRLSRVNAVASATGIAAPLAIGAVDSLGATGRLALLAAVPPLLALAVFKGKPDHPAANTLPSERDHGAVDASLLERDHAAVDPPPSGRDHPAVNSAPSGRNHLAVDSADSEHDRSLADVSGVGAPRSAVALSVTLGWLRVVLAVGVEFCFVVWAVARLLATGLPVATAALLGSAFPIGMAIGRAVGPIHLRTLSPVVPGGLLAIIGTLLVSLFDTPTAVALGLVVAGAGVAPLYPVTLAALVAIPGLNPTRLSAIGALASGTAILLTPAALAALSRAADLRTAYLITLPLILVLIALSRSPSRSASSLELSPTRRRIQDDLQRTD